MVHLLLSCGSGTVLMGLYLGVATLMVWLFPHMQQGLQPRWSSLFAWFCYYTSKPLSCYMHVCVCFVCKRYLLWLFLFKVALARQILLWNYGNPWNASCASQFNSKNWGTKEMGFLRGGCPSLFLAHDFFLHHEKASSNWEFETRVSCN